MSNKQTTESQSTSPVGGVEPPERTVESDSRNTPWHECPITRRPFFMNLDHPDTGEVPTFGGPFDSYTIPEVDDDGELRCERYDHDAGSWVEGGEPTGLWVTRGQPFQVAERKQMLDALERAQQERNQLRTKAAEIEADCNIQYASLDREVPAPQNVVSDAITRVLAAHHYNLWHDYSWIKTDGPYAERYVDTEAKREAKDREKFITAVLAEMSTVPAPQPNEWQPIETAPKDGTEILAMRNVGVFHSFFVHWRDGHGRGRHGWWGRNQLPEYPTHWLPLPDPPKAT